jgi:hypothetical protein
MHHANTNTRRKKRKTWAAGEEGGVLLILSLKTSQLRRSPIAAFACVIIAPSWSVAHANQLLSPLYQAQFYSTMRFFGLVVLN